MENFQDMFAPEELRDELKPYLSTSKAGWRILSHPLIIVPMYAEQMNRMCNLQYAHKKEAIDKAILEGDYGCVLAMTERPYRLDAFVDCVKAGLTGTAYWENLGWLWIDSENIWQNKAIWKRLLKAKIAGSRYFMDEDERKTFDTLPEEVKVYRGAVKGLNEKGMSWSTDKAKAEWFSKRLRIKGQIPVVLEKTVPRIKIFACKDRGESEVIIL